MNEFERMAVITTLVLLCTSISLVPLADIDKSQHSETNEYYSELQENEYAIDCDGDEKYEIFRDIFSHNYGINDNSSVNNYTQYSTGFWSVKSHNLEEVVRNECKKAVEWNGVDDVDFDNISYHQVN